MTAIVGLTAFVLIAYNGIISKPQDGLEIGLSFGYWLALLFRDGRERGERQDADLARMADGLERANEHLAQIAELLVAERRRTNGSRSTRQRSRSS